MANIGMSSVKPSLASVDPCPAHQHAEYLCGEDLFTGALCFLDDDMKLYLSSAAISATAIVDGIVWDDYPLAGTAATIWWDTEWKYADETLTPGTNYFLSDTPGRISDTAGTVSKVVARSTNKSMIYVPKTFR